MTWALLPVKDLVKAKSRLAGILAPHERRALAQAMVEDVIATLTGCKLLEGVLLVSDDPCADLLAHRYGIRLLKESELGCRGLNPVVAGACDTLTRDGAGAIMVVHGDIPLLSGEDVEALLTAFRDPEVDVVLSPDRVGGGTNILLFDAGRPFEFHYGVGSCQAHQAAAIEAGLRSRLVARDGVSLDIDAPEDLILLWRYLKGRAVATHTARFINKDSVEQRLSLIAASNLEVRRSTGT